MTYLLESTTVEMAALSTCSRLSSHSCNACRCRSGVLPGTHNCNQTQRQTSETEQEEV